MLDQRDLSEARLVNGLRWMRVVAYGRDQSQEKQLQVGESHRKENLVQLRRRLGPCLVKFSLQIRTRPR